MGKGDDLLVQKGMRFLSLLKQGILFPEEAKELRGLAKEFGVKLYWERFDLREKPGWLPENSSSEAGAYGSAR